MRSVARGSRVRKPAFLRPGRSSGSTSMRARARPRRRAPAWPDVPPPCSVGEDVELLGALGHHQRLADELLVHLVREVLLEGLPVAHDAARARHEADADDGLLAAADRLDGAVDLGEHRRGRGVTEDVGLGVIAVGAVGVVGVIGVGAIGLGSVGLGAVVLDVHLDLGQDLDVGTGLVRGGHRGAADGTLRQVRSFGERLGRVRVIDRVVDLGLVGRVVGAGHWLTCRIS